MSAADEPTLLFDGTYEVVDVLGESHLGTTVRLLHRGWGVELAAEMPSPALLSWPTAPSEVVREVDAWVRLGFHPHIVSCYYVRALENVPMIFRELVDGGSLADWLTDGRLYEGEGNASLVRILRIATQLALAAGHAHKLGVVHQDLRPANVLMTRRGLAKVTGFGLLRALAPAAARGNGPDDPGLSWGGVTPAYSPLEQLQGDPPTAASDVWSWAVTVVELFAGERRWQSALEVPALLEQSESWADATAGRPALPRAMRSLLQACLNPDAASRPDDMLKLADAIAAIVEEVTGEPHPRPVIAAKHLEVRTLTNRAVALLDLGQEAEAEALLRRAVALDPKSLHAAYDLALLSWRGAQVDDLTVARQVAGFASRDDATWDASLALAWVQLERGDAAAAEAALDVATQAAGDDASAMAFVEAARNAMNKGFQLAQTTQVHNGPASAVVLDAQGRFAVTAGYDGTLRAWDRATSTLQATFPMPGQVVRAFAMTPNAARAVTAIQLNEGNAGTWTWDVALGQPLARLNTSADAAWSVAISADGEFTAAIEERTHVVVWDTEGDEEPVMDVDAGEAVFAVAMTPSGATVVGGDGAGYVHLWDVQTEATTFKVRAHEGPVSLVAIDPDAGQLLTGGADGGLRVWRIGTEVPLRDFRGHVGAVRAAVYSPDRRLLYSGGEDGTVRVWLAETGQCVRTLQGHVRGATSLALEEGGRRLFVACGDGMLRIWDLSARMVLAPPMLARATTAEDAERAAEVFTVALAAAQAAIEEKNYRHAIMAAQAARAVPGYDRVAPVLALYEALAEHAARGPLRSIAEVALLTGHREAITAVGISEDGSVGVSASADGTARVWDLGRGACRHVLSVCAAEDGGVLGVAMSADGSVAVTSGGDKNLRLWRLPEGAEALAVRSLKSGRIAMTPDGEVSMVAVEDAGARVWRVDKTHIRPVLVPLEEDEGTSAVALAVGGELALTGALNGSIYAWRVETARGKWRAEDLHTGAIRDLAASPDGRLAAAASADGKVSLWSVEDKRLLQVWAGLPGGALSVAITADGELVVAGAGDGSLRLWHVESGEQRYAWSGHKGAVAGVAIAPDARWILTGGADGIVRLWMVDWELALPGA